MARIHRRVKLRIRETNRRYQYPRSHSFRSLLHSLMLLGLVTRTGEREVSDVLIQWGDRAGELRLDPARGFAERVYYRLVPGTEKRVEWADPMAYIALIYPIGRAAAG